MELNLLFKSWEWQYLNSWSSFIIIQYDDQSSYKSSSNPLKDLQFIHFLHLFINSPWISGVNQPLSTSWSKGQDHMWGPRVKFRSCQRAPNLPGKKLPRFRNQRTNELVVFHQPQNGKYGSKWESWNPSVVRVKIKKYKTLPPASWEVKISSV